MTDQMTPSAAQREELDLVNLVRELRSIEETALRLERERDERRLRRSLSEVARTHTV